MPLSEDERAKLQSLSQLRQQTSAPPITDRTEPTAQGSTNFFDQPFARQLFPSGGQMIGGLAAGALATPETVGVGTMPAALTGGVAGGVAGENLRQLLAKITGGGPRSYGQQYSELAHAGSDAAIAESVPVVVGATGRMLGRVMGTPIEAAGRAVMRNIPDPVMQYARQRMADGVDIFDAATYGSREALFGAANKLKTAVATLRQQPTLAELPSPKALYPIAEKAANAFEAVRDQVSQRFGQVAQQAEDRHVGVSLRGAYDSIRKELRAHSILDLQNNPIKLGDRGFTGDEGILLSVYRDFANLHPGISHNITEGGETVSAHGTFARYPIARRMLDRIDEALGSVKTRNAKRILADVRQQISGGLARADTELAKALPEYGTFVGLRDVFEHILSDPDKTVAKLLQATKDTKQGLAGKLQQLDALAPKELKFLPDLQQYGASVEQAKALRKAPKTMESVLTRLKTPQDLERFALDIFQHPESTQQELEALDRVSPFLTDLKDIAAHRTFKGSRPAYFGPAAAMGATGASIGGRIAGVPGAVLGGVTGFGAGSMLTTPSVQGSILQRWIPLQQRATAMGNNLRPVAQAAGATARPAIASLLKLLHLPESQ